MEPEAFTGAGTTFWSDALTLETSRAAVPSTFEIFKLLVIMEGIIGILGNGIVLVVLFSHNTLRKMTSNYFLVNQTVLDLFTSILLIVEFGYHFQPLGEFNGTSGLFACQILETEVFLWIGLNASTFSLVLLTIERYLKIVHPVLHHNQYSKVKAMVVMTTALIVSIILNMASTFPTTRVINGECWYLYFWPSAKGQRVFGIFHVLIIFFLPLIIFAFCYTRMLMALKTVKVKPGRFEDKEEINLPVSTGVEPTGSLSQNTVPSNKASTKLTMENAATDQEQDKGRHIAKKHHARKGMLNAQRNITKTLIIVSLAFVVCWSPNAGHYLLYNLGFQLSEDTMLYRFTVFMAFGNCCINPFIYVLKYEEFKVGLRKLFRRCR